MKFSQSNILVFIVCFLAVGIFFGIFTKLTLIPAYWPSVAMILIFTLVYNGSVLLKPSVYLPLLLYAALIIYDLNDHLENLPEVTFYPFGIFSMVYYFLIISLILENFILLKNRQEKIAKIGKFVFFILIFGSIITIVSEYAFPGIARSKTEETFPNWVWTFSFGTTYGISFFLATIVAYYRGKTIYLLLIYSILILALLKVGLFTSLIFAIINSIIGLMFRFYYKNILTIFIVLILFLGVVWFNAATIIAFLPELPNEIYQQKSQDLMELSQSSSGSEFISYARQGVYQRSIDAMQTNFFTGTGNFDDVGMHSFWLDKLGFIGLLGTFIYALLIYVIFMRVLLILPEEVRKLFKYLSWTLFILLFLNPFEFTDFWLLFFVFMPSIIIYFYDLFQKKQFKINENSQKPLANHP